ncbi:MAG: hypothetical protein K2G13_01500 [Muribaculaceae bacterium]|nr:hypothetical protein [Muribaculaceae bacterium]
MAEVQTDAQVLRAAVRATHIVTIPRPIQAVAVRVLLVAHHAQYTVKILLIIQAVALDLHVPVSVRENVLLRVLKHVQATVLENAAMDARTIVETVARIHVQEAVDDSAAYLAVALAVENAPQVAPHSVSISPKVVVVEAVPEVAV